MGFTRQEYWSGLAISSPGDLPDPGIEPSFPALQADSLLSERAGKPTKSRRENEFTCDDLQIVSHLMFLHKKNISFSLVLLVAGKDL